jgi:SAM-dependent methyltransferase
MSFYSEFANYYDQFFPLREEVYSFLKEQAGRYGGAVLDAGCGTGSYCGRFLHDGFRVTGVDLDNMMIDAAKASYPEGTFLCMDITGIASISGKFQFIYSIGNVLAHLSPERLAGFLASVHAVLETGGCWIFQLVNWDYLLTLKEYTFPVKALAASSTEFHRCYSLISAEQVVFEVQLSKRGKIVFNEQSLLYPLTSEALVKMHTNAGFSLEGIFSGFDKSGFTSDRNSGLVMAFAKKKGA